VPRLTARHAILLQLRALAHPSLTGRVACRLELLAELVALFLAPEPLYFALGAICFAFLVAPLSLGDAGRAAFGGERRAFFRSRAASRAASCCGTFCVPFNGIYCQRNRPLNLDCDRPFGDSRQVSG
jgi:hypothetical protein